MSKFSQGGSAAESGPLARPQGVTLAPPVEGYGLTSDWLLQLLLLPLLLGCLGCPHPDLVQPGEESNLFERLSPVQQSVLQTT